MNSGNVCICLWEMNTGKSKKEKRKKMLPLLTLCCVFMVVPNLTERAIISGTQSTMENSSCPHRLLPEQSRL